MCPTPMTITLFSPEKEPVNIPVAEFNANLVAGGTKPMERVAELLGCPKLLVDVLATGETYAIYTIYDCGGEINPKAMEAAAKLTGIDFNMDTEFEVLRGNVLVLSL